MKKIRVGIIGQGRSGRSIHGEGFNDPAMREMYEVAGVTDGIAERCRETANEHPGCKVYTDYHAMLEDRSLDLIVNCSFNDQHVPISIECMEAGFDVVCEKPLARTVAAVDEVMAVQRQTGRFISVFQEARLRPHFQKTLEVIRSGKLGRILQATLRDNGFSRRWDWQTLQANGGGNLSNNGPHAVDQALALLDFTMPEKILSVLDRANTFGDADDFVKILLAAKGKPVIDVEVSSCAACDLPVLQLYAEFGSLTATFQKVNWKYYRKNEAAPQKLILTPLANRDYCTEKLDMYEETWKDPDPEARTGAWLACRYYEQLYPTLTEGKPFFCTLDQVRKQIAIIEECHRQNPLPQLGQQG